MKKLLKAMTFLAIFAALLLSACQIAGDQNTDAVIAAELEGGFLSTHFAEDDMNTAFGNASRAVIPDSHITSLSGSRIALPTSGSSASVSISNYPEQGQTSSYVITREGTSDIYQIAVTTNYGGGWVDGIRASTVETYRIRDSSASGADGYYSLGGYDIVVNSSGSAAPRDRVSPIATTYRLKRQKGASVDSIRYESIDKTSNESDSAYQASYASFANASLEYDWDYSPAAATTETVNWSSMVSYTQEIPASQLGYDQLIQSDAATYYLEGKRYYTEIGASSTDHAASSLSVERVYEQASAQGRLIATVVTRSSYVRTAGVPGTNTVTSKATYYLSASDILVELKTGSTAAEIVP